MFAEGVRASEMERESVWIMICTLIIIFYFFTLLLSFFFFVDHESVFPGVFFGSG